MSTTIYDLIQKGIKFEQLVKLKLKPYDTNDLFEILGYIIDEVSLRMVYNR